MSANGEVGDGADGGTLRLPDGREVRFFDTAGGAASSAPTLVWHSGTPHTGRILGRLAEIAAERGLRVVSVARPGYGGSTRLIGRSVADAARDALAVLDHLGVERFATVGASGGGPHALALAALAGERASGVATFASVGPYRDDDPEWFTGMASPGALRAAARGLAARTEHERTATFDEGVFTVADWAALDGEWAELGQDAGAAESFAGPDGLLGGALDDDCAFAADWGVDLGAITAHVLIVQGEEDRMVPAGHATRILRLVPDATSWWFADDGHVSALRALPHALDWLIEHGLR
ncbi:MAG: alpha/beta hydrolase [Microbacteriaceae bacterium]|nr:alpha/beta hydrolase [Microbacteriaceae bacterium]MCL2794242.1 alpha/beta hydrolase [Microbacteriaceae bacterium]